MLRLIGGGERLALTPTGDGVAIESRGAELRWSALGSAVAEGQATGAALAVTQVLPELEGKLDGISIRVPTAAVSLIDLTATVEKEVSEDEVKAAFREAAEGPLKGILAYTEEELVSSDFTKNSHSAIVDGPFTKVLADDMVKVLAWYDNEWGYSSRVVELAHFIGKKL